MNRIITSTLAVLTMAMAMGTGSAIANENAYETTLRSTAWIVAGDSRGTGVLVDREEQLVITNYHVTTDLPVVQVFFPVMLDGRAVSDRSWYQADAEELGIRAEVVATDKARDIAILKLDRIPEDIVAIEIGEPTRPGQNVHSIGNPGASDAMWIYTYGKVRQNYYRKTRYDFGYTQMQMLETDSPINPGDSGGPMVDDQGRLVGISQGLSNDSRLYSYGVDISEITWYLKKYRSSMESELPTSTSADETTGDSTGSPQARGSFQDLSLFAANSGN
ncbi:MAG: S1 family peptidase [Pirellulaceae bacterium]